MRSFLLLIPIVFISYVAVVQSEPADAHTVGGAPDGGPIGAPVGNAGGAPGESAGGAEASPTTPAATQPPPEAPAPTSNNAVQSPVAAGVAPGPPLSNYWPGDLNKCSYVPKDKNDVLSTDLPQYSVVMKTLKTSFSFYLWPREVCSVVEVWSVASFDGKVGSMKPPAKKITFKAMEQLVFESGVDKPKYYPYTKVEFAAGVSNLYQLQGVGLAMGVNCTATHCQKEPSAGISLPLENYIAITTNSPFCQIRPNPDVNLANYQYWVLQKSADGKEFGKADPKPAVRATHQQRLRNNDLDKTLPGMIDAYTTTNEAPAHLKCCPSWSDLYSTGNDWRGTPHSLTTVAEYQFGIDTAQGSLRSFMLEIKEPEKCSWVRVCFKARCGGNSLVIMPRNGIMIRTDDNKAVMLGATTEQLHSFRIEMTNTKLVLLRYAHASDVLSGVTESMFVDGLPLPGNGGTHTIALQRSRDCVARLNNDYQETSLVHGKSKNVMKMQKCKCYEQKGTQLQ